MIKMVKWLAGFIAWTLLYYLLNYFIFKSIFNDTIMELDNTSKFVLILSIIASFATSFGSKLFNIKNILFHLSIPITLGASKILEIAINLIIYIVNKFSYIVSAPILNSVDFKFRLIQNTNCENSISGLAFAYFTVLVVVIVAIILVHYEDLNNQKYGYGDFGYDDDCD